MPAKKIGPVPGVCINGHEGSLNRWTNGTKEWISCSHKDWDGYCNAEAAQPTGSVTSPRPAPGPAPPPATPVPLGDAATQPGEVAGAIRDVAEALVIGLGNVADALRSPVPRATPPDGPGADPSGGPETALRSTRTGATARVDIDGQPVRSEAKVPTTPPEQLGQILENLRGGS